MSRNNLKSKQLTTDTYSFSSVMDVFVFPTMYSLLEDALYTLFLHESFW